MSAEKNDSLDDLLGGGSDEETPTESPAENTESSAGSTEQLPTERAEDLPPVPTRSATPRLHDDGIVVGEKQRVEPIAEVDADSEDAIHVHFLTDGFTALGRLWYRGEELIVIRGSAEYQRTQDRDGNSWLDYEIKDQWDKWGEQKFGYGPWPGKTLADAYDPEVHTEEDRQRLEALAADPNATRPAIPARS